MRTLPLAAGLLALLAWNVRSQPAAVAVGFDSVIHPITVEILTHAIEQAQRQGAPLVLVRLNTPGGMLDATQTLVERMNASPLPVVTFVTPSGGRAASAGFILLLAGDVAAMRRARTPAPHRRFCWGRKWMRRCGTRSKTTPPPPCAAWPRATTATRPAAESTVYQAKSFTSEEALDQHLIDFVVRDESDLLSRLDGREVTRPNGPICPAHGARAGGGLRA